MRQKGFTLTGNMARGGLFITNITTALVAVNPGRQFAQARDTQRRSDLYAITNSVYQFAAEHNGNLPDNDGDDTLNGFPQVATCIGTDAAAPNSCFNLGTATNEAGTETIVSTYIAAIPMDPGAGTDANTQYTIYQSGEGRLVAEATGELTPLITVQR